MISDKEQNADLSAALKFITSNFKTLLSCTLFGMVLAFILTLFIPKEYTSFGVVFPPSSTSIDNSIEFPNFGYDLEADRLIQILQSKEIRDSVIKKFDLVTHFLINKNDPAWKDDLIKQYYKSIYFDRSISMSVVIYARTKDPQLSSDIVNYIIEITDVFREKVYKKNINSAYESSKLEYEFEKRKVDSTEIALIEELKKSKLSSLLLLISDAQVLIDIEKLNASNLEGSHDKIGSELIAFKNMTELLKEYKKRYINIRKSYLNPIPKLFVINSAEPNLKKVSPSMAVNILIGAAISLFAGGIILLIRKAYVSR